MNDIIIHAPLSKIMEAIRKKDLEVWGETFSEANGEDINHFTLSEEELTEALASLELQDEMPSSYLEGFRDGMKATKSHPSERDASLGGEEPKGEWRIFETSTALGDTGDYMHSTGITNGENTLIFEDETDEDGVLINIVKKLNSHLSKREELEGFVEYINKTMTPFGFSKEIIDRYLA